MTKKILVVVSILAILAPVFLISSADAAVSTYIVKSIAGVKAPKAPVAKKINGTITATAGTRPTITLNFSTVPAKATKKLNITINVTDTASSRAVTLTGELTIASKAGKITSVTLTNDELSYDGTDSAGSTVNGTVTATGAFTKLAKALKLNTETVFSALTGEIGTIGTQAGSYTYEVGITGTGVALKYKGKAFNKIGGTLTVN